MKKKVLFGLGVIAISSVLTLNISLVRQNNGLEISLNGLLSSVQAQAETTPCCIGSTFKIESIPGGWRCINGQGNSCCPIC